MIRSIIGAVVIIAIGTGIVWMATRPREVDAAPARRDSISAYVEERAVTRLPRTYRITMPISGRIMPISLEEGDHVRHGEVVARIEPADLDTEVEKAAAKVRQLEAEVVRNNDDRLEQSALEGISAELEALDRTVEAAEAKTEASKARNDYFSSRLKRIEEAFEGNAASDIELDEAKLQAIEGRVDYQTDILTLRALEAIRRAAQIGPRIVKQYIDKKSLTENVLQQQITEARAAYEFAVRNRERGDITAPCDGVVLNRAVSNERMLQAGELLLEIGRLDDLQVEVEMLTQDASKIVVGDRVEIFDSIAGGESIEGTVTRIEPRGFTKISSLGVEQQRVLVIVDFNEGELNAINNAGDDSQGIDQALGVGYRVHVRIHTNVHDNTVVIPRSALFRGESDQWQVFLIRNNRAERVPVQVGLMNDREAEILEGISPDELVILAPESELEPGARVTPRK